MTKFSIFNLLSASFLLVVSLFLATSITQAVPSQLKQSIVPLECYIDAVNSGNGSHLYITPEDCLKEEATDTIKDVLVPNLLTIGLEGQDESENSQVDSDPKSQELEPSKRQDTRKVNIYDNLRTDPLASLLVISMVAVPVTVGIYLLVKPKPTIAKK